jgi:hypothetical protein
MIGRSFAFTASRTQSFREARTHCRIGNGVRFLETRHWVVHMPGTNYSAIKPYILALDFNALAWGQSRQHFFVGTTLNVLDGGSQPPGESRLGRELQSGINYVVAVRAQIRGFNIGWLHGLVFVNDQDPNNHGAHSYGGWRDMEYPAGIEIPFPGGAPNGNIGDSARNTYEFDLSPAAWELAFAPIDLIGYP